MALHLQIAFSFTSFLLSMLLSMHICPSHAHIAGAAAPSPSDLCNGIFLTYSLMSRTRIHPFRPRNPVQQPYSFRATASILNSDYVDLKAWSLRIGLPNGTVIVSADPAILSDGSPFPAVAGPDGASFSGFPATDLLTAIETAGDLTQIQVKLDIAGTMFGNPPPAVPMPAVLTLDNLGYNCQRPTRPGGANDSHIFTCCTRDPKYKFNDTILDEKFSPRRIGDLTITYDVTQSFPSSYLVLVTVTNGSPLGRVDNWRLTWQWMRGEFIYSMQGAYPSVVDNSECIFGDQGQYYQDFDFSKVVSCSRSPTILDLPPSMADDNDVGRIPNCCRNGTILPKFMDPSMSTSAFQMEVFKMPPDINRTKLFPPQNWRIVGAPGSLNPDYQCGPSLRVGPTQFPSTSGLQSSSSAIASWEVVCNITRKRDSSPRCCVSYSAFYNDSVVPCNTCACGCSSAASTCNSTAPALLLPYEALLVPFVNRASKARAWAELKHFNIPNLLPCPDNCGVNIHWHISTDYAGGWSVKMTLFNWEEVDMADWFAVLRLDKAYACYETMYSFNGTTMGDNTIFMRGLPGLNYLMAETDGANPQTDPRVPGKQQTVISFTKKENPGIDVVAGDGFPSKVFFNGEECSLPNIIPINKAYMAQAVSIFWSTVLTVAVILFAQE